MLIDIDRPIEYDDGLPCEIYKVLAATSPHRKKKYGRRIFVRSQYDIARRSDPYYKAMDLGFFNEIGGQFGYSEGNPNYRRIVNVGPAVIENWRL
jgi:hypothetical protein